MKWRLALAAGLVAACGWLGQAAAETRLARIFRPEMLKAEIAYLETITGPALHIDRGPGAQRREYPVDGCKVTAYAKGTRAVGYALALSPKCNFDLAAFLGNGYGSTAGLTIGKFAAGAFGPDLRVQSACVYLCGNAADAAVDFTFEGPHAVDFVSIVLTVVLADQPSVDASERWQQPMRQQEGRNYVAKTRFNCARKYHAAGVKAFADVPVNEITIGYEPNAAAYERSCRRR